MSDLKPCPFCGGESHTYEEGGTKGVQCKDCPANVDNEHFNVDVVKVWNIRSEWWKRKAA